MKNNNYKKSLALESEHWDQFEKEIIEGKKIIPWWLDLRNASQYTKDGKFFFDPKREEIIRGKFRKEIVDGCHPGKYILDVGCGSGWLSLELARKGCHVTAIDVSSYRVNLARNYYEDRKKIEGFSGTVKYLIGDVHEIEFEMFDCIAVWDSLHHLDRLDDLFSRLESCLKPGGKFFCYDHLGSRLISFLGKIRRLYVYEKVSACEDLSGKEIEIMTKKYFFVKRKIYKITVPFRLMDFFFFRKGIFIKFLPAIVWIDELLANGIGFLGREFIFISAEKK